ncbi:MAG TPA: alpha/beta hydrolase [Acidimicrobiales bacterium]
MTTRDVIAGDRHLTLDDVGDPAGVPVLYLHGTPDSRLSRHPDDGLATTAGVRLLALDRPGYGGSDPLPPGTADGWPAVVAADAAAVLDTLGIERCGLLAWSGGALAGVALAALMPERVSALAIVAGLVPRQAYDDPEVRAAGADRLDTIELADSLPPGTLGEAIAPLLAPYPCDRALAAEHQAEQRDAAGAVELATVPGGAERLADGLVEAVRRGLAGVAADVEAQARPMPLNLAAMRAPVRLVYGSADTVTPPAFGRWYAENLPGASLDVVDGAAHYVALTAWGRILATFT